jgi:hypothetical protein
MACSSLSHAAGTATLLVVYLMAWPTVAAGREPPGKAVVKRGSLAVAHGGTRGTHNPLVHAEFSRQVRRNLDAGYAIALDRVREIEACQGLFAELGADGVELLQQTIYLAPRFEFEQRPCDRGASAFTFVGRRETRLCDRFGRLTRQWAAVLLIHEALHFAGQTESPGDPEAPSGHDISRRVAKSCGL